MRVLPLGVLLVSAALSSGCKKKGESTPAAAAPDVGWLEGRLPESVLQGSPKRGGTLHVRVPTEPPGLNRLHDQLREAWMVRYLVGTVYEALAEIDKADHPRYRLEPLLAESWVESEDHLTLTVKLRKGVRFHDGTPMTARDVKATLDAVMNPENLTASIRSYFVDLDGYRAVDDHTFELKWKKPYFLANRNFLTTLVVMPAHALKGDFDKLAINRAPIGTGPFRFSAWETGRAIRFVRNDDYWGEKAFLDGFVVHTVKDHTVATELWQRGTFDLMTFIQPPVWKSLETNDPKHAWAIERYHRIKFPENQYSWIGWNHERPFFADARVRKALAHLYPVEHVYKNIDLGLEEPTTCPYYRDSPSCDRAIEPLPYDPAEARRLLAEAGWTDSNGDGVLDKDGVPFKFSFMVNPHSVRMNKLAPLLKQELRKVGIEMEIEKVDQALYVQRMRTHSFDAGALAWASGEVMQDNYQIFHSSQAEGGSNYVSYKDREVDELLERIRVEFDDERRHALERRLHKKLFDDQVYLFMTNRVQLDAVKKSVKGIRPSVAWYDLARVWLDPEKK